MLVLELVVINTANDNLAASRLFFLAAAVLTLSRLIADNSPALGR